MIRLRATPSFFSLISLIGLVVLITATSPSDNILFSLFFFLLSFVLAVNLAHLIAGIFRQASLSVKARRRIRITAAILVIAMMFQATRSLNWISGSILLIITLGLLFYSDRRSVD
ncbi:hypothetical protein A3F65_02990 [Candidatus Saccharibacteria bacterium RIFCSPHIGHO2_12_FULL_47_16b]|nr:MAG: hypothetical protein A3F65_02990 [Candidatus Saccharibacteria bacterium RIFCSPHIGHO2_12_FULL_47_16b]OGL38815.1 MAG: hypothetical protein A3J32_01360 [Candidatus Saccharibacteria bacterium RIFCSPLOWO2_02_FULL_46_7]